MKSIVFGHLLILKNGSLLSSQDYATSQTRPLIPNTAVDYTAEMVCHVLPKCQNAKMPKRQKVDRLEQQARCIATEEYK